MIKTRSVGIDQGTRLLASWLVIFYDSFVKWMIAIVECMLH